MQKKLVVITGASSGIGKATAKRFAELGYPMLLLARNVSNIDKYDNSIAKSVDITKKSDFENAIKEAEEKFGKTEFLINNAGVMLLDNVYDQDPAEWQQMIDVNMVGLLNGVSCVLKDMTERNSGTIVNISSIAGKAIFSEHAVYCGTKFAVHAMSEAMRQEVSSKSVRVSVVAPGIVKTNLLNSTTNKEIKDNYASYRDKDLDGALEANDIADAILYICQAPQHVCIREVVLAHTNQRQ